MNRREDMRQEKEGRGMKRDEIRVDEWRAKERKWGEREERE